MTQNSPSPLQQKQAEKPTDETDTETGEIDPVVNVLNDEDCRRILQETDEVPRATRELSERCDLPLSTTYRKIEALVEAGLLEEEIDLENEYANVSAYTRRFDKLRISFRDGRVKFGE